MKTNLLFLMLSIAFAGMLRVQAQVPPQYFSYSAVVRGNDGLPLNVHPVGLELKITNGNGATYYSETFSLYTDQYGGITVYMGAGSPIGSFMDIDWQHGEKYLEVGVDITGGQNYQSIGNTRFLSVPYAMVTEKFMLPYIDSTMASAPAFLVKHEGAAGQAAIKGIFTGTQASGVGVQGITNSTSGGVGVYAQSTAATSIALYATSPETANSGTFDGGMVSINNNPETWRGGNLTIKRSAGNDPAIIQMGTINMYDHNWRLNAINTPNAESFTLTNTGVQLFKISGEGGLSFANSSGTSGQVLTSSGTGSPYWSTPGASFNNTYLFDQWTTTALSTSSTIIAPGQLSGNNFTVSGSAKLIIHFSHANIKNEFGVGGGGNSRVKFTIELVNAANNTVVNQVDLFETIPNGESGNLAFTHHCQLGGTGTFKVNIKAQIVSGDGDVNVYGVVDNHSPGQLSIQVIHQ
jgi:hypothetical protein